MGLLRFNSRCETFELVAVLRGELIDLGLETPKLGAERLGGVSIGGAVGREESLLVGKLVDLSAVVCTE